MDSAQKISQELVLRVLNEHAPLPSCIVFTVYYFTSNSCYWLSAWWRYYVLHVSNLVALWTLPMW